MRKTFLALFVVVIIGISLSLSVTFGATIGSLYPSADGSEDSGSWTTTGGSTCSASDCYVEVDEVSGGSCSNSDGDTSYIESNTSGATQTFTVDISSIADGATITEAAITFCGTRTQGGAVVQARFCADGSCSNSGVDVSLGNGYSEATQTFSGLSITKSGATSIEIGLLNNAAKGARISQVSTIITYTPPVVGDTTAPTTVSDLALSGATANSVDLSWTATGDDGGVGTASSYDIRYSTSEITAGNFDAATTVTGEPTPSAAGVSESMTVTGLSSETTYYFAMKVSDEVPNTSSISNVPNITTAALSGDSINPSAVLDLSVSNASASSLDLDWTAPGDDGSSGTATSYDIRYSTAPITDLNFTLATQVSGEPTPSIAGTAEFMTVTDLSADTTYHFAIKASDEAGNEGSLSNVPSGTTEQQSSISIPESSGGGGSRAREILVTGMSFPGARVELFQRSIEAETYNAVPLKEVSLEEDGQFYARYLGLVGGEYFVGLRFTDKLGNENGLLSFAVDFSSNTDTFLLEDIVVPPSVGFKQKTIARGSNVEIQGYAAAGSRVELKIGESNTGEAIADSSGYWSFSENTNKLLLGKHSVRARQIHTTFGTSTFSSPNSFTISRLVYPEADFNGDNTVNITDWSLFLFRWASEDESLKAKIDLDKSGVVDIFDLSIFLKAMTS